MAGLSWWSVPDDGRVGSKVERTLHHEGRESEFVRIECTVRVPWWRIGRVRLVARAYQATDELTLAVESIRVEGK